MAGTLFFLDEMKHATSGANKAILACFTRTHALSVVGSTTADCSRTYVIAAQ